jgi:hypothetical protein
MTTPPNPAPAPARSLTRTIAYWVTTVLVVLPLAAGGVQGIMRNPEMMKLITNLGYPAYFGVFLGTWELLGVIALLIPGTPLLKEWAYAGIVFDLIAAVVAHVEVNDSPAKIATPIVVMLLTVASWALRPASRRLAGMR